MDIGSQQEVASSNSDTNCGIQLVTTIRIAAIAITKQYGHTLQPRCLAMEILVLITVISQGLSVVLVNMFCGGFEKIEGHQLSQIIAQFIKT